MHRQEDTINPEAKKDACCQSQKIWCIAPSENWAVMESPHDDGWSGTHRQDIVKVCHNIVSIMENQVNRGIAENNASDTPDGEESDEQTNSQNRYWKKLNSEEVRDSCKDLDPCRNPNEDGCCREINFAIQIYADWIHVMGPHNKSQKTNAHNRPDYAIIAEEVISDVISNNVTQYSKPRENQDIDLRMAKKPKKVLEEYRVTTPSFVKIRCVEVTVE